MTPMARRYQLGWVLLELQGSGDLRVFLRLPAYVTHRMRALAQLPLNDLASPWSNRLHTPTSGSGELGTSAGPGAVGGQNPLLPPAPSPAPITVAPGNADSAKLQARVRELEAKIRELERSDALEAAASSGKLNNKGSNI